MASTVTTKTIQDSSDEAREVPVRWIVLFTGSTATADYEPTGSAGETSGLIEEVARMCVAFHPHNDIRLFPKDRAVTLFWRAQTSGDYVVTRITTAPNPEGARTALEYVSLLFKPESFALLGNNPFRTYDLDLHGKVRAAFLSQQRDPLTASLTDSAAKPPPAAFTAALPATDAVSTPENVRAVEDYCARLASEGGGPPPTFATWWASRGWVPPGYFEILLRAAVPQAMTLREATDAASALGADTKAALPSVPGNDAVASGLIGSILSNADALVSAISGAAERVNTEGPDEFRERLAEGSRRAAQVGSDLSALQKRLTGSLAAATVTRLAELGTQYIGLSQEVLKIRHPNPFGARKTPPTDPRMNRAAVAAAAAAAPAPAAPAPQPAAPKAEHPFRQNGTRPGSGTSVAPMPVKKSNPAVIPGIIAAVAIVGFGVWKFAGHGGTAPGPTPSTHSSGSTKSGHSSPANTATAAALKPADLLKKYADEAQPIASAKARAAATESATKGNGKPVSEDALDTITMQSIQAAYKETLTPADYNRAFAGSDNWDYAHYRQSFSSILPSVRKAAQSSAAETVASIKQSKAAIQAAVPTPAPPPERTPAPERTPQVAEHHHHNSEDTGSQHSSPPKHSSDSGESHASHETHEAPHPAKPASSGSGAGSAAAVGL